MTDDERPTGEQGNPGLAAAFLVGLLTAGVIAVASFVFLGLRLGFSTIWERTGIAFTGVVLDMPDELIDELTAVGGVIGNAGNPTKARKHDTILVQPDEERGYVLRPGASGTATISAPRMP